MALEEILAKNTPDEGYDKEKFVGYYSRFNDAQDYYKRLTESSNDFSAKQDLCKLLFGNGGAAEGISLERLMDYASNYLKHETEAMAKYSRRNQGKILDKLTDKEMLTLATKHTAIKGIDNEHDSMAKIINENIKIAKTSQDAQAIVAYVDEEVKKAPQWFKEVYSQSEAQLIFSLYADFYAGKLKKLFLDKEGKINRKKAENFYKENIDKIKTEYDAESNEGDKSDIMNMELNPRYISPSQIWYPRAKTEVKWDKDKPREERKLERKRDYGMAA